MPLDIERLVPLLMAAFAYGLVLVLTRKQAGPVRSYATLLVGAFAFSFALWHLHGDDVAAGQGGSACLPLWALGGTGLCAASFACGFLLRQYRFGASLEAWSQPVPSEIAATLADLAPRLNLKRTPEARLIPSDRPLACVAGLFRPRLYLSSWMEDNLGPEELEGVLAHELAHIAQRDNLIAFVATTLLGAAAWLPTNWLAWQNLFTERELAADALAVAVTGKPVALARVLHRAACANTAPSGVACGLLKSATAERRIRQLVALHKGGTGAAKEARQWSRIWKLTLLVPPGLAWLIFALPHLLELP
ncbi:M56 family metallopeptidase [Gloeobacter kilaueensis]|uniref:Heat shock protein HtpX n=1 Tax=Gloeobacter kilaueensis (strain ATCC BAA-2537 / CCAP 1431/1 / ULC 316 / JS1) TaxID=1183438 RepID=U5QH43_GLOK1|nr:M56 family metallopeptidase [Gloeobacter kilaueensis]AGY58292.1 heat shock protein HtpX [Gloeobacter kilaueensis JS1]